VATDKLKGLGQPTDMPYRNLDIDDYTIRTCAFVYLQYGA